MTNDEPKDDTKSIKKYSEIIAMIQFPSREEYLFDKQLTPEDISNISKIWGKTRKEIQIIEQAAKSKIILYLQEKGYKVLYKEKLRFT